MKTIITILFAALCFTCLSNSITLNINGTILTITPISEYPRTNVISSDMVFVMAKPGITNFGITYTNLLVDISTNQVFTSSLANDSNFLSVLSTNSNGSYYLVNITNTQTSFIFDYSRSKNFELFSTRTNATALTFSLTNINLNGGFYKSVIVLRNLMTNNLLYSFPTNISWVSQASTNTAASTNIFGGQVQQIEFVLLSSNPTNASIIGSVNP